MRPFQFIHINKTAGTSIEAALGIQTQHISVREAMIIYGDKVWHDLFTFTIVRNPWDRVFSHYQYRVMTNQTNMGAKTISFTEWTRKAYGDQDPEYFNNPKLFMPQVDWIVDQNMEIHVDMIGRFEHLEEDFKMICKILGCSAVLPHLKRSSNKNDYRKHYDAATIGLIAQWFAEDIGQFGYGFE